MKGYLSFAVLALLGLAQAGKYIDKEQPCHKASETPIPTVVKTKLEKVELPEQHIWNDVNGTNYLTNIRN
jgi:hypothetical protein